MNDATDVERLLREVSLENDGKELHEATGIMFGWSVRHMLCDKKHLEAAWKSFVETEPFW
jgi:hypothetical protein